LLRKTLEGWCAIKAANLGLAIVVIVATALVLAMLNGLLRSTQEVARLLRAVPPSSGVPAGEGDASKSDASAALGAAPEAGLTQPRAVPALAEAVEDAGVEEEAAPEDAASEEVPIPEEEAGLQPEAAPLVEAPQPVQCGWRICPEGQVCCNWSCSTCAPPGQICDYLCGAPSISISIPCGRNTCNVTEVCCNHSCGICVPSGETCSQEPCLDTPYDAYSAPCGKNTCNVGEVCCNPSCGICTKPGERCSIDPCP
jgi:hypothetical protein